jgi:hypothetical protein
MLLWKNGVHNYPSLKVGLLLPNTIARFPYADRLKNCYTCYMARPLYVCLFHGGMAMGDAESSAWSMTSLIQEVCTPAIT